MIMVAHCHRACHISTDEAKEIIRSLNEELGSSHVKFYPGIGYRHILKLKGYRETLEAACTPPHDIPGKPVADYLPQGTGSRPLIDITKRSEDLLRSHRINEVRRSRSDVPVSMVWLFWGSGRAHEMPGFRETYGIGAAMTSGVDLLRGMALMVGMKVLNIKGVTDGLDNDYNAQAAGALEALEKYNMVVIHIEAPDDAGHDGLIDEKVRAIENIDGKVVSQLLSYRGQELRVLIMPDHPTPITLRTHSADPVPFLLWGDGIVSNGGGRFTEPEAAKTGLFIEKGYKIMGELIGEAEKKRK